MVERAKNSIYRRSISVPIAGRTYAKEELLAVYKSCYEAADNLAIEDILQAILAGENNSYRIKDQALIILDALAKAKRNGQTLEELEIGVMMRLTKDNTEFGVAYFQPRRRDGGIIPIKNLPTYSGFE